MLLDEYLASEHNLDAQQGNPSVRCNAIYKTSKSFNCNLTPTQAIEFARYLLQKAQLILDANIEDAVVQVWNAGNSTTLSFGLTKAVKRHRRKKKE